MVRMRPRKASAIVCITAAFFLRFSAARVHCHTASVLDGEDKIIYDMADKGYGSGSALLHYGDFLQLVDMQSLRSEQAYQHSTCSDVEFEASSSYLVSSIDEFTHDKAASICDLDRDCVGFALHSSNWSIVYKSTSAGHQCEVWFDATIMIRETQDLDRNLIFNTQIGSTDVSGRQQVTVFRFHMPIVCAFPVKGHDQRVMMSHCHSVHESMKIRYRSCLAEQYPL